MCPKKFKRPLILYHPLPQTPTLDSMTDISNPPHPPKPPHLLRVQNLTRHRNASLRLPYSRKPNTSPPENANTKTAHRPTQAYTPAPDSLSRWTPYLSLSLSLYRAKQPFWKSAHLLALYLLLGPTQSFSPSECFETKARIRIKSSTTCPGMPKPNGYDLHADFLGMGVFV